MKKHIPWVLGGLLIFSNLAWLAWTIDTAITRAYDGSYEIRQAQQEQTRLLQVLLKDQPRAKVLIWLKQAGYSEPFEKNGCVFAGFLTLKFSSEDKVLWLTSQADPKDEDLHYPPT